MRGAGSWFHYSTLKIDKGSLGGALYLFTCIHNLNYGNFNDIYIIHSVKDRQVQELTCSPVFITNLISTKGCV